MNINTFNIFKIYAVCVFLYVYNKYTQYTHTYYVNKLLFWMRLIVWQHYHKAKKNVVNWNKIQYKY